MALATLVDGAVPRTPDTLPVPPEQNFRFYDTRQKYLMFGNTFSEKWVLADRAARELEQLVLVPPTVRLFDASR